MKKFFQLVLKRRSAYRALFQGPASELVLADLQKFCRATTTPAVVSPVSRQVDPIATGIAIGRLEVWNRIRQNIAMTDSDLYRLMEFNNSSEEDLS